jgi:hypothetical protein
MRRLESKAAATRRTRSEFDNYSDSILRSEPEATAVTGFSPHTLKFWRLTRSAKGPRPTYLAALASASMRLRRTSPKRR